VSVVVSDSSPLNYLALLSDFDLLRQIYKTLVIPPAVYREVVERGAAYPVAKVVRAALGEWISVAEAPDTTRVDNLRREYRLDLGESEAILVAESLGKVPLLMDERRGSPMRANTRYDCDSHATDLCGRQDPRIGWQCSREA
jgi:predicted nucleic acid-binding protein